AHVAGCPVSLRESRAAECDQARCTVDAPDGAAGVEDVLRDGLAHAASEVEHHAVGGHTVEKAVEPGSLLQRPPAVLVVLPGVTFVDPDDTRRVRRPHRWNPCARRNAALSRGEIRREPARL